MIKALIFDFGNVFLNLEIEKALEDALNLFEVEGFSEEMIAFNCLYEQGLITTDEFIGFYQENFPKLSELDIINCWNAMLKDFPPHRLEFIKELSSEKKYKLFLLSNTNELHMNWVKNHIPFYESFKNCFDGFYLSHEIGFRKPNANIFEFVLKKNELKPSECLFIDDTKDHILSASKLGIHTWNIDPKQHDITNLFKINNHLF